MQEISSTYRKLMRAGSLLSLFLLGLGLVIQVLYGSAEKGYLNLSGSFPYLMSGIVVLLATPMAGLLFLVVYNVRIRQYPMAWLGIFLIILLIGGTWLIHPGN